MRWRARCQRVTAAVILRDHWTTQPRIHKAYSGPSLDIELLLLAKSLPAPGNLYQLLLLKITMCQPPSSSPFIPTSLSLCFADCSFLPLHCCSFAGWIKEHSDTEETPLFEEEQTEETSCPAFDFHLDYWSSYSNWSCWAQFPKHPMTPQVFYNTGIDHLLDGQLNHLKKYKRGYWLESTRWFICQAGKARLASEPDWYRGVGKRKTNAFVTYVHRGQEEEREFLVIWQEHPLPQQGQQGHAVLVSWRTIPST